MCGLVPKLNFEIKLTLYSTLQYMAMNFEGTGYGDGEGGHDVLPVRSMVLDRDGGTIDSEPKSNAHLPSHARTPHANLAISTGEGQ